MTAIETIKEILENSNITLSELAEYADLGSKSNISQMLGRSDLKVGTFVQMLEVVGYQLIAQNVETGDNEIVIDYDV